MKPAEAVVDEADDNGDDDDCDDPADHCIHEAEASTENRLQDTTRPRNQVSIRETRSASEKRGAGSDKTVHKDMLCSCLVISTGRWRALGGIRRLAGPNPG